MKEYFYLVGKEQKGPFSLEALKKEGISNETYVWTEGMEDWQKLKDLESLKMELKPKATPPPIPQIKITEKPLIISGDVSITKKTKPNEALETIKPSRKALTFFLIWFGFNLFALITSYSKIEPFSKFTPQANKFWPIVDFYQQCDGHTEWSGTLYVDYKTWTVIDQCYFSGIFLHYDITEFMLYVGGVGFIFLIAKIARKNGGQNRPEDSNKIPTPHEPEEGKRLAIKRTEKIQADENLEDFPELEQELTLLREVVKGYPKENIAPIIIGFCRTKSIPAIYFQSNLAFCQAVGGGKIQLSVLEKLFELADEGFQEKLITRIKNEFQ
jgi:hypothetical protein